MNLLLTLKHSTKVISIGNKEEFLRMIEQHALPKRYGKIRHYEYLQNYGKKKKIEALKEQLQIKSKPIIKIPIELKIMDRYQIDILKCRKCSIGQYQLVEVIKAGRCTEAIVEVSTYLKSILNKAPPSRLQL